MRAGKVKIDGVSSQLLGKTGVIRIRNFATSTAEDVKKALTSFKEGEVSRLVIDLRGNTGGYFTGGVDVARLLLPKDTFITYVRDYKGDEARRRPAGGPARALCAAPPHAERSSRAPPRARRS